MTNIPLPDGVPPDFSEEFFQSADKCKAEGIIESVKKPLERDTTCYNLRIKLKGGEFGYVLYGVGNNPNCTAKLGYDLSGENYPKVGEHFYAIGMYSGAEILKTGERNYNENINLPDCPKYYNYLEEERDIYDNLNKCQISGKISKVGETVNKTQPCEDVYSLNIEVGDGKYIYYSNGSEYKGNGCFGLQTNFPIYNGKYKYFPKVGDDFSAVLNMNGDYGILKYGKEFLSNDIPYCTGNILRTVSNDSENISQEIKLDETVKIKEKPTSQSSTGKIVIHSNSGIVTTSLVAVPETNTGGLIESGILVNSGNLVKIEDIQNTSNSGIETRYQTGLTQEEKQEPPKVQPIHNTQNYYLFGIIVVLLIIIVFGVRKIYFSKK